MWISSHRKIVGNGKDNEIATEATCPGHQIIIPLAAVKEAFKNTVIVKNVTVNVFTSGVAGGGQKLPCLQGFYD